MRHGLRASYGTFGVLASEMLRERLGIKVRRNLTRALFCCERDVTVYPRTRFEVSVRAAER